MNDNQAPRTHYADLTEAQRRDPGWLWNEFGHQVRMWEISRERVPAHEVVQILKDFVHEGWQLDDVFLERVYRDRACERFDRDLVRAYRDARTRDIGGLEIGD